jgi:hypothetical protein
VISSGEDGMNAQEIIRELAKLNGDELTQVDLRLFCDAGRERSTIERSKQAIWWISFRKSFN